MGLTVDTINQCVRNAEYAVRGELAVKSEEFRARLAKGDTTLPFKQVISANIGNPQQLDQKPITFFRQVLSLLENPLLLQNEDVLVSHLGYQTDVIARAKKLLAAVGSVGAYSASNGVPTIKESIAKFIEGMFRNTLACTAVPDRPLLIAQPPQNAMASPPTLRTSTSRPVPRPASTPFSTSSAPPRRPAS